MTRYVSNSAIALQVEKARTEPCSVFVVLLICLMVHVRTGTAQVIPPLPHVFDSKDLPTATFWG
jgi:hypothetical protein